VSKFTLTAISVEPIAAQAIAHFIKKSTLNLEHHTSAGAGTQSIHALDPFTLIQHFVATRSSCSAKLFISSLRIM
jgi:hypothetical protein